MFCDQLVAPRSRLEASRMADILRRSGYTCVGIEITRLPETVQAFLVKGFNVTKVLVLEAASEKEFRRKLSKAKERTPDATLVGRTVNVATFRAMSRDPRVKVVEANRRVLSVIDRNQRALLEAGQSVIGVNLSVLLRNPRSYGWFKTLIERIYRYDIPFALYSNAVSWNEVWHPYHIRSLFQEIVDNGRYGFLGLRPPHLDAG